MKKMFLLPILIFILSSCNTIASNVGVNDNLYSQGKDIIQFTASNIHAEKMEYSKDQQTKVDNFQSKYKNLKTNDNKYYELVVEVIKNYTGYGKSIEDLQSNYKINLR